MKVINKQKGRKCNREKFMIKTLKSLALMASGLSKTIFLSSDPNELCNRLKLLLPEKQAEKILTLLIKKLLLSLIIFPYTIVYL